MHDMHALSATNENRYHIIIVFAFTWNTIFYDSFPLIMRKLFVIFFEFFIKDL